MGVPSLEYCADEQCCLLSVSCARASFSRSARGNEPFPESNGFSESAVAVYCIVKAFDSFVNYNM